MFAYIRKRNRSRRDSKVLYCIERISSCSCEVKRFVRRLGHASPSHHIHIHMGFCDVLMVWVRQSVRFG